MKPEQLKTKEAMIAYLKKILPLYPQSIRSRPHYFMQVMQHTQPFYGPLSGSTQVRRYQKKHPSTHNPPAHQPSLSASSIYHKPSSLLNPRTWQSLCTTSNHVLRCRQINNTVTNDTEKFPCNMTVEFMVV